MSFPTLPPVRSPSESPSIPLPPIPVDADRPFVSPSAQYDQIFDAAISSRLDSISDRVRFEMEKKALDESGGNTRLRVLEHAREIIRNGSQDGVDHLDEVAHALSGARFSKPAADLLQNHSLIKTVSGGMLARLSVDLEYINRFRQGGLEALNHVLTHMVENHLRPWAAQPPSEGRNLEVGRATWRINDILATGIRLFPFATGSVEVGINQSAIAEIEGRPAKNRAEVLTRGFVKYCELLGVNADPTQPVMLALPLPYGYASSTESRDLMTDPDARALEHLRIPRLGPDGRVIVELGIEDSRPRVNQPRAAIPFEHVTSIALSGSVNFSKALEIPPLGGGQLLERPNRLHHYLEYRGFQKIQRTSLFTPGEFPELAPEDLQKVLSATLVSAYGGPLFREVHVTDPEGPSKFTLKHQFVIVEQPNREPVALKIVKTPEASHLGYKVAVRAAAQYMLGKGDRDHVPTYDIIPGSEIIAALACYPPNTPYCGS